MFHFAWHLFMPTWPLLLFKFLTKQIQTKIPYRRALWNLLRVEWENIKQQKALSEKEVTSDDEEDAPFLSSPVALPMSSVPAKRANSTN